MTKPYLSFTLLLYPVNKLVDLDGVQTTGMGNNTLVANGDVPVSKTMLIAVLATVRAEGNETRGKQRFAGGIWQQIPIQFNDMEGRPGEVLFKATAMLYQTNVAKWPPFTGGIYSPHACTPTQICDHSGTKW